MRYFIFTEMGNYTICGVKTRQTEEFNKMTYKKLKNMEKEDYLLNFAAELGNAAMEIAAKYENVTIREFFVCLSTATIGILEQISAFVGENKKDVVFDFADKLKDAVIHSDDYLLS